MLDASNRCQADGCNIPAIVKVRAVALCSDHLERINLHVQGSQRTAQALTTEAVLALVSHGSGIR